MTEPQKPLAPQAASERKPWPMIWILIIILGYVALQTAYFLFLAD